MKATNMTFFNMWKQKKITGVCVVLQKWRWKRHNIWHVYGYQKELYYH